MTTPAAIAAPPATNPMVETVAAPCAWLNAEMPTASHSVPEQCGVASDSCDLAITPNTLPTTTPATPTPATTTPSARCVEPLDEEGGEPDGGGEEAEGAAAASTACAAGFESLASGGISTDALAPGPSTRACVCHVLWPGALARMACAPGSIGMGVPHSARPTFWSSRVTTRSGRSAPAATVIVSVGSRGSSLVTLARASFARA